MTRLLAVLILASCSVPAPLPPSASRLAESVVAVMGPNHTPICAGVMVRQGVLTAAHCVPPGDQTAEVGILEHLDDSGMSWTRSRIVPVLRVNRGADIALLDYRPAMVPWLSVSDRTPQAGDRLRLFGHPLGLPYVVHTGTVSRGPSTGPLPPRAWFLTDAGLIEGMSGGPAIDDQGEVIGIISAYISTHHELGILVSPDAIRTFLEEIR